MHKQIDENDLNLNPGYAGIVKYLVEHGADIEVKSKKNATPLFIAAVNGNQKKNNI